MNKLLKDAIADAKAVRETALANAKLALEETFQPKLQSMLSKKIKEEAEDEEQEEEMEKMETETARFRKLANISEEDEEEMADEEEVEMEEPVEDEEEIDMDIDDEEAMEDGMEDEEMESEEEEDLDLEAIIRELEDEGEMEEEGVDTFDYEEGEMHGDEADEVMEAEEGEEGEEVDEEIDINELIDALKEGEGEEEKKEDEEEKMDEAKMKKHKMKKMEEDIEEAYGVIKFLKSKINEVNLLNAKLLYVNKIFRNKNLTESQKVSVIETFDRAKTVRETKLIYTTISESLIVSESKATNKNKKRIVENFASTPVKKTNNPIIDVDPTVARFQKLAGINK